MVTGQDQDELDGGYNKKQSWSGAITQYNLWDFVIEDYDIANLAECRSSFLPKILNRSGAWLIAIQIYIQITNSGKFKMYFYQWPRLYL